MLNGSENIGRCVQRKSEESETLAYRFVQDNGKLTELGYGQLHSNAMKVGRQLSLVYPQGARVVLMFRPGLEFINAFLACIYAGIVAVPVYPPSARKENWLRLSLIVRDAGASALLMDGSNMEMATKWSEDIPELKRDFLLYEELLNLDVPDWSPTLTDSNQLAFLQYTSGSTGKPKGVMVSHGNIMANQAVIKSKFSHTKDTRVAGWLPQYHDMGLIGNILQPLYLGTNATLMSPATFLQNPYLWLEVISDYGINTSGAPSFAYELCIERISDTQKECLDLSTWSLAFNGAEPINAATMRKFSEKFAECGFREESFYPCYGLAESTLFATGGQASQPPVTFQFNKCDLTDNKAVMSNDAEDAVELVSSGKVTNSGCVVVDPETHEPLDDGLVGEIWIDSPSVTQGYWNADELTQEHFNVALSDNKGSYLRTGDLGFVVDEQLFINGRLKDLIIINGKNYFPQDIENAAQRDLPQLRVGHGACFSVSSSQIEKVVLIQEVDRVSLRKINLEETCDAIVASVKRETGIVLHDIILTKPNRVLKTSSGKVRRRDNKQQYETGEIDHLYSVQQSKTALTTKNNDSTFDEQNSSTTFLSIVAEQLGLNLSQIEHCESFADLGVDSIDAVRLQGKFKSDYGLEYQITDFLYGKSIEECSQHFESQGQTSKETEIKRNYELPKRIPLSANQLGIWQRQHFQKDSSVFHLSFAVKISSQIHRQFFQQAIEMLLQKHSLLTMTFVEDADVTFQQKTDDNQSVVSWIDGKDYSNEQLQLEMQNNRIKYVDITKQDLPLKVLCYETPKSTLVQFVIHHIVTDFWSLTILVEELFGNYEALTKNKPIEFAQDYNYFQWAERESANVNVEQSESFLTLSERLNRSARKMSLPSMPVLKRTVKEEGRVVELNISQRVSSSLLKECSRLQVTPFNYLLVIFQQTLNMFSGDNEFVVGTPMSQREPAEHDNTLGCFVDLKLMPCIMEKNASFVQLLNITKSDLEAQFKLRHLNFGKLYHQISAGQQMPIPNVRFNFHKSHLLNGVEEFAFGKGKLEIAGLELSSVPLEDDCVHADIALTMALVGGQLKGVLNYNASVLTETQISYFAQLFELTLCKAIENPGLAIQDFPSCSTEYLSSYLSARQIPERPEFSFSSIHQYFEQRVQENPESCAVIQGDKKTSYKELNEQANKIAYCLSARGVGRGQEVGLCMTRSVNMVASFLAIIKVGCKVVLFEHSTPIRRSEYMIESLNLRWLLTDSGKPQWCDRVENVLNVDTLCLDSFSIENSGYVSTDDVAYLLFTSGSTGKPKAVQGCHRGIINRTLWMQEHFGISTNDIVYHCTPMNFVRAERELFFALCSGATLALSDTEAFSRPDVLMAEVNQYRANFIATSPSMLEMICEGDRDAFTKAESVKHWFIGADILNTDLVKRIQYLRADLEFSYFYGSTEVSSDVSCFDIPLGYDSQFPTLPVGKPLSNTGLYILNDNKIAPDGIPGELFISGFNLSAGYINDDKLNREKFCTVSLNPDIATTMYRTGDQAFIDSAGHLHILGRKDGQLNILGNRVDLAEVESALNELSLVDKVKVIAEKDSNNCDYIVAFVVSSDPDVCIKISTTLTDRLPKYMLPQKVIRLNELAYTPLGKVDIEALRNISNETENTPSVYKTPDNEVEVRLLEIWAKLLNKKESEIDVTAGFFENGGNSFLLTKFFNEAGQAFSAANIKLTDVYQSVSLRGLAERIRNYDISKSDMTSVVERGNKRRAAMSKRGKKRGKLSHDKV